MTGVVDGMGRPEFDPFGAAVAAALLTGGAAVVLPFLAAATGTLSALAIAAWAVDRTAGGRRPRPRLPFGAAAAALGGAAAVFLASPEEIRPFRSVLLAIALLGFYLAARVSPTIGAERRR